MVTERIELQSTESTVNTQPLEIPRDSRGRIRWSILKQDPNKLAAVIETKARSTMGQGINLTHTGLTKAGFSYLAFAIQSYYPGRFTGLRQALDLPSKEGISRTKYKHWGFWREKDNIEAEAHRMLEENNLRVLPSKRKLLAMGYSSLSIAAHKRYPGGIQALRETLAGTQHTKPILAVIKDHWGRVAWTHPGNTLEEDFRLGINNMQALLLKRFPEFDDRFPRGEDEKIVEDKREEAKAFILKLRGHKRFVETFGGTPRTKKNVPYFEGSQLVAIVNSFSPWGLDFGNIQYIPTEEDDPSRKMNHLSPDQANEQLRKLLEEPYGS